MSEDLSFARKYRPNTMMGYVGNKEVKEKIMTALEKDSRPQVIMLWGDSGCGKTTLARLLAKEYSCTNRDPLKGACGVCPTCKSIDEYITTGNLDNTINIMEFNVADQSGKNDLDEFFTQISIPVFGDEWKVFILDEVQSASIGLQNRLLKITEEPPEHVLICFCTTNPEKILDTLKNRCQLSLHIKKPTTKELSGLLKYVCEQEDIKYNKQGLDFISNRADRTIRTSLQYLNDCATQKNSALYEDVIQIFETVSEDVLRKIFVCLKKRDTLGFVSLINDVKSITTFEEFMNELKGFVVRGIYVRNGVLQEGISPDEYKTYAQLFEDLTEEQVLTLLNKIIQIGKSKSDIEIELLTLGYSGLATSNTIPQKVEVNTEDKVKELQAEVTHADAEFDKQIKKSDEQGIENASKLAKAMSLEDILGTFGGKEISK